MDTLDLRRRPRDQTPMQQCNAAVSIAAQGSDWEPPSHLDRCASCGGPADLVAESVSGEPIAVCWDCHEPWEGDR